MTYRRLCLFLGLLLVVLSGGACDSSKVRFYGADQDLPELDTTPAPDGDGDAPPASDGDAADPDPEPEAEIEAEIEVEAEFGREWVDGTAGFCRADNEFLPATDCRKAADCLGYLRAPSVDCGMSESGGFGPAGEECGFANKAGFPVDTACSADELCQNTPRACIDGHCKALWPKAPCAATSDCKLFDLGCVCVATNGGSYAVDLAFGRSCPASGACEATMEAACVRGTCAVVGSYMNAAIEAACRLTVTCASSFGSTLPDPEKALATCINNAKEDHYARAALNWSFIRSLQVAQTCNGLINGPGQKQYECIYSRYL